MKMQRKFRVFSTILLCLPALANAISGGITQYGPGPGSGGACGFTKGIWPRQGGKGLGETMLAAINIPMWEQGMNCGLCISVKATKVNRPPVTVMVIDQCPPCTGDSLDLSMKAWREVTGIYDGAVGKEPVTWDFVPCPPSFTSGDMYYLLKEGSNAYALRVNPQNFPSKIKTIQIRWSGQDWKDMIKDPNTEGLYWKLEQLAPIPSGYELRSIFVDGTISGSSGPIDKFDSAVVGQSSVKSPGGGHTGNSTGGFTGPVPSLRGSGSISQERSNTNTPSTSNSDSTGSLSNAMPDDTSAGTNSNSVVELPSNTSNADATQSKELDTASEIPMDGNAEATGPLFTGSDELNNSPNREITDPSGGENTGSGFQIQPPEANDAIPEGAPLLTPGTDIIDPSEVQNNMGSGIEEALSSETNDGIPEEAQSLTQKLTEEGVQSAEAESQLPALDPNPAQGDNTESDAGINSMPSDVASTELVDPNVGGTTLRMPNRHCKPKAMRR